MTEFTPGLSLLGGAVIGLAAVMMMLALGRIAGVSGIAARLLPPIAADWSWRAAFVAGLVAAPVLATLLSGSAPAHDVSANLPLMAAAGLLVGFGSVFGSGCTSGHGVCGISRLSRRSILATLAFMSTAFAVVLVTRHFIAGS